VIRRADPALGELDKVLKILAEENKVLGNLAEESNKVLAPLAAVRGQVGDFIAKSATVSEATAAHRTALAANLTDFPAFLKQLGPAMERLGRFAEQTTPVFDNLKVAAPGLNQAFTKLAPFAGSSNAFFKTLGQTAKGTGPALAALKPLLERVRTLGGAAKPFSGSLSELFTSLRSTGGLERLLDLIFLGAGTTNGYDSLGHFLRAEGVANTCLTYALKPVGSCSGKVVSSGSTSGTASSASAASTSSDKLVLARTLAELGGATPAQALAKYPGSAPAAAELTGAGARAAALATPAYSSSSEGAGRLQLNYLLGE
jgi:hypothetical protein